MANIMTLRGAVLSKYKTIGEFSEAIGWKRNKSSRILNGIQTPSADEIEEITKWNKHGGGFHAAFFAPLVHKMDKQNL